MNMALGLLFLLGSSSASLVFPKLLGELVDLGNQGKLAQEINRIALILIAVLVGQSVFSYFRVFLFVSVAEKTLADLRQAYLQSPDPLTDEIFPVPQGRGVEQPDFVGYYVIAGCSTSTLAEFLRQIIIIIGGVTPDDGNFVKINTFHAVDTAGYYDTCSAFRTVYPQTQQAGTKAGS